MPGYFIRRRTFDDVSASSQLSPEPSQITQSLSPDSGKHKPGVFGTLSDHIRPRMSGNNKKPKSYRKPIRKASSKNGSPFGNGDLDEEILNSDSEHGKYSLQNKKKKGWLKSASKHMRNRTRPAKDGSQRPQRSESTKSKKSWLGSASDHIRRSAGLGKAKSCEDDDLPSKGWVGSASEYFLTRSGIKNRRTTGSEFGSSLRRSVQSSGKKSGRRRSSGKANKRRPRNLVPTKSFDGGKSNKKIRSTKYRREQEQDESSWSWSSLSSESEDFSDECDDDGNDEETSAPRADNEAIETTESCVESFACEDHIQSPIQSDLNGGRPRTENRVRETKEKKLRRERPSSKMDPSCIDHSSSIDCTTRETYEQSSIGIAGSFNTSLLDKSAVRGTPSSPTPSKKKDPSKRKSIERTKSQRLDTPVGKNQPLLPPKPKFIYIRNENSDDRTVVSDITIPPTLEQSSPNSVSKRSRRCRKMDAPLSPKSSSHYRGDRARKGSFTSIVVDTTDNSVVSDITTDIEDFEASVNYDSSVWDSSVRTRDSSRFMPEVPASATQTESQRFHRSTSGHGTSKHMAQDRRRAASRGLDWSLHTPVSDVSSRGARSSQNRFISGNTSRYSDRWGESSKYDMSVGASRNYDASIDTSIRSSLSSSRNSAFSNSTIASSRYSIASTDHDDCTPSRGPVRNGSRARSSVPREIHTQDDSKKGMKASEHTEAKSETQKPRDSSMRQPAGKTLETEKLTEYNSDGSGSSVGYNFAQARWGVASHVSSEKKSASRKAGQGRDVTGTKRNGEGGRALARSASCNQVVKKKPSSTRSTRSKSSGSKSSQVSPKSREGRQKLVRSQSMTLTRNHSRKSVTSARSKNALETSTHSRRSTMSATGKMRDASNRSRRSVFNDKSKPSSNRSIKSASVRSKKIHSPKGENRKKIGSGKKSIQGKAIGDTTDNDESVTRLKKPKTLSKPLKKSKSSGHLPKRSSSTNLKSKKKSMEDEPKRKTLKASKSFDAGKIDRKKKVTQATYEGESDEASNQKSLKTGKSFDAGKKLKKKKVSHLSREEESEEEHGSVTKPNRKSPVKRTNADKLKSQRGRKTYREVDVIYCT